jgi:hypothetical protein
MRKKYTSRKINIKEKDRSKRIEEQEGLTIERRYICYM